MSIKGKLKQIEERVAAGQVLEMDLEEFLKNPQLWRQEAQKGMLITPEEAQVFWQGVWDQIRGPGKVVVPPIGKITEKQRKALGKFDLLLMYLGGEEDYPLGFVKPNTEGLGAGQIELLKPRWVAIEITSQYNYVTPETYKASRLMAIVRPERPTRRFVSWNDFYTELREGIAQAAGFPKSLTELPSLMERCLVANLFRWLDARRGMKLPDLDYSTAWEWCRDKIDSDGRRVLVGFGGLCDVELVGDTTSGEDIVFRAMFVL